MDTSQTNRNIAHDVYDNLRLLDRVITKLLLLKTRTLNLGLHTADNNTTITVQSRITLITVRREMFTSVNLCTTVRLFV